MIKPSQARYDTTPARARIEKTERQTPRLATGLVKMTATMKRRALKKKKDEQTAA